MTVAIRNRFVGTQAVALAPSAGQFDQTVGHDSPLRITLREVWPGSGTPAVFWVSDAGKAGQGPSAGKVSGRPDL
jgi:hypothetical protein